MTSEKIAVITGSGQGIGKGIAFRLAKDGFTVVINDIDGNLAEETAKELQNHGYGALAIQGDVSKKSDVFNLAKETVEAYGKIDVFINNAGIEQVKPLEEVTEEELKKIFDINVFGVIYGIQAATEQMKKQEGIGKIINACSIAGHKGFDMLSVYSATKFSVRALTQAAAQELAPHQITVNSYCPGIVGTEMWVRIDKEMGKYSGAAEGESFAAFSKAIALGRTQEPEDVANFVSYLASSDSDYMTGQSVMIDGGVLFS
ncbi:acetoin reductase [Salipaludibacillus daqingensis]|uniref:acetoin reductase n=1 Tax=Salipaludibacillus daqingensis TaxID=3041001 RepID=UPI002476BDFC|nr:acetoin reductase [Salipaludibacillus daqingensis]